MATPPIVPNPEVQPVVQPVPTVKVFTQDQVEQMIANARREEKDKLYSDLEKSREKVTKLETRITSLEGDLDKTRQGSAQAEKLQDELKELRKELETANEKAHEKFEKVLDAALDRQKKEFEDRWRKGEIETYRKSLIDGADGKVIEELVIGNTVDELKANFEKAKAKYESIANAAAEAAEKKAEEKLKGALPRSVTPGASNEPSALTEEFTDWKTVMNNPAAWAQKKEEMKKKAFADAGLPMRVR